MDNLPVAYVDGKFLSKSVHSGIWTTSKTKEDNLWAILTYPFPRLRLRKCQKVFEFSLHKGDNFLNV